MLLSLVAIAAYVHRPSLSLPWVVILLCVDLENICRHPPGLKEEWNGIVLDVVIVLEFGKYFCIVLMRSKRVLDWSTARLCSAIHTISACILVRLSNTCLNCSYW